MLEGIKVDGRWAVIYSRYDIGCALEKNKSSACKGYDPESAMRLATAALLYALKRADETGLTADERGEASRQRADVSLGEGQNLFQSDGQGGWIRPGD